MSQVSILQLLDYLDKIKPEERPAIIRDHLAQAWTEGLDFAGAALRGGCSLTEAATANPYRKVKAPVTTEEAIVEEEFQHRLDAWRESPEESREACLMVLNRQVEAMEKSGSEHALTFYRLIAVMQSVPNP
jgi:hypothetical protein